MPTNKMCMDKNLLHVAHLSPCISACFRKSVQFIFYLVISTHLQKTVNSVLLDYAELSSSIPVGSVRIPSPYLIPEAVKSFYNF